MRAVPVQSIFISKSQSTPPGETSIVALFYRCGHCGGKRLRDQPVHLAVCWPGQGQILRVTHPLSPSHPNHSKPQFPLPKTCSLSASSRYMLMSSCSVPLGEGLCSSQHMASLSYTKAELFATLSWRRKIGFSAHYCILNKEVCRIRSNKMPVIPVVFGRTSCCLPGLEGLFVMATSVLRRYSSWLFAAFDSWRKWSWCTELARSILLWSCDWPESLLSDYLLDFK